MSDPVVPTEQRLTSIETRLRDIETRLGRVAPSAPPKAPPPPVPARAPAPTPVATPAAGFVPPHTDRPRPTVAPAASGISVTGVMASGAGVAFVLAAVYFLKLVYDFGWLTPERQVGLALLGGIGLIVGGISLANRDRQYAAYLPGAGIVVVYLTVYAADLYYGMIGPGMVVAGVGATTLVAIWLQRHFGHSVYALFAVVGAYLFPILIPSRSLAALDMIVYFAAWGLLFSWVALQSADRTIYVLALWFSLLGFDIAWRLSAAADAWTTAAVYQFLQFILFAVTAAVFSMRHRRPLDSTDALTHGAALFTFYGLEYALLQEHAPSLAPGIALASVVVVLVLLAWTRSAMGEVARGGAGAVVASAYASFVTAHVVLFDLLPEEYFAWAVLLLPALVTAVRPLTRSEPAALVPLQIVSGVMFAMGLLVLSFDEQAPFDIPFPELALLLYAGVLYVGAAGARRDLGRHPHPPLLLYAGHVALMVTTVKALDSALAVSIAWAVLAVALLMLALRIGDRVVGRSSLLIFFASSLKVLLYDLDGSPTLVRVIILIVLGCSLYLGGWLYQRVPERGASQAPVG